MNTVNQKKFTYEELEEILNKRDVELHDKYGDDYFSKPIYKIEPNKVFINNAISQKYEDFARKYSALFKNSSSRFFILTGLVDIYSLKVVEKGDKYSPNEYEHILDYEEKTVLLERTFNILKSLDNRDDILKSFLHNTTSSNLKEDDKKRKMWYYLLNDASLIDGILSWSDFRKQNPKYDEKKDAVLLYEKNKHLYEKHNTDVLKEKVNSFLVESSQSK